MKKRIMKLTSKKFYNAQVLSMAFFNVALRNITLYFCSQLRKKFMDVSKKNISYLNGNAKATTFLEMALFIKVKLYLNSFRVDTK